ncbi:carotenoid oxygenase family protein [Smaragdicoccus niigatensis]|uniref:carotenoid oxygenase family protein n=1 Tax=Smaragdicoccus niigatensis TaxID=359359 RepID=UPI00035D828F|nr:carotenoid oxygenase family protein [Smaragdicoccus niigatensis]
MTTSALNSNAHPALSPAREVSDEIVLDVTGQIPAELRGTLYRNGPGRFEGGGFVAQHAFDGDGLISKFVIDGGAVRFQSRYVRTSKFRQEEAGNGAAVRGMGNQRPGGILANIGRFPADSANTHAVVQANRLLALSDAGRPWEIDLDDLTTRGACDFDGKLPVLSRFSPHPRFDPVTGEMFNFGLDFTPHLSAKLPITMHCYRVDRAGRLHTQATVPLRYAYIQHDFAITEHYLVFVLAPIVLDPVQAMLGLKTAERAMSHRPDLGTKIVLVPRAGGRHREIECPPLMYIHINNAFEDRGDVVIDLVRYDHYDDFFDRARDFRTRSVVGGFASRVRVGTADKVTVEDFSDQQTELPQHDWRRTSREYRYGYHTTLDSRPGAVNRIVKVDAHTARHVEHVFEPGDAVGEPIFVPRSATAAEDDGWLLTVVYIAAEHRSALVVLDARDPSRAPIAVARLDRHFFPGFHGSFTSRVAAS